MVVSLSVQHCQLSALANMKPSNGQHVSLWLKPVFLACLGRLYGLSSSDPIPVRFRVPPRQSFCLQDLYRDNVDNGDFFVPFIDDELLS